MADDYRNTKYCPAFTDLSDKKVRVKNAVLEVYPRAIDMHRYISRNDLGFKQQFIEAYNGKCAYCGVPISVIGQKQLEIDHFIPQKAARFTTKKDAGYIENLVLACYDCNRSKSDLELPDDDLYKVNPDGPDICRTFYRDDDYYIRISEEYESDTSVKSFYYKLRLDSQTHRLDYLLVSLRGLRDKLKGNPSVYVQLNEAIELMQQKRI